MNPSPAEADCDRKRDELERMLNDPDSRMEPDRVWALLDELSRHETAMHGSPASP